MMLADAEASSARVCVLCACVRVEGVGSINARYSVRAGKTICPDYVIDRWPDVSAASTRTRTCCGKSLA